LIAMQTTTATVLGPDDGKAGSLGAIGVRFMLDGARSGGGVALVEHPIPPRALAAPLHRHTREDEYSYVLEGRVGALLGDDVVVGGTGDLIFKPRGQWHTFWNAGDEPARILEVISPAGFERFFEELVDLGGPLEAAPDVLGELCGRYELEMAPESIPGLVERFGLRMPGAPA
jgi:mannose-6-phosphate isomerase-like protein (cupin superfamily)